MGDNQFDPNAPYGQPQDMGQQNPQGFDPNAMYQQEYDPNAQMGYNPNAQQGYDPNAQMGYDPNAQQGYNPDAQFQNQTMGRPFNGGNFVDLIKADPIRICAYVGCFFIFLSSWLPRWVYMKVSFLGISESAGEGLWVTGGGILKLYAILFLLLAAWTVMVEFNVNSGPLGNVISKYKSLPFSQFYAPCVCFILWLLCIFNGEFRDVINSVKDASGVMGDAAKAGYGFVTWMCLIGIILLLVRPVMAIINKKNPYWD